MMPTTPRFLFLPSRGLGAGRRMCSDLSWSEGWGWGLPNYLGQGKGEQTDKHN